MPRSPALLPKPAPRLPKQVEALGGGDGEVSSPPPVEQDVKASKKALRKLAKALGAAAQPEDAPAEAPADLLSKGGRGSAVKAAKGKKEGEEAAKAQAKRAAKAAAREAWRASMEVASNAAGEDPADAPADLLSKGGWGSAVKAAKGKREEEEATKVEAKRAAKEAEKAAAKEARRAMREAASKAAGEDPADPAEQGEARGAGQKKRKAADSSEAAGEGKGAAGKAPKRLRDEGCDDVSGSSSCASAYRGTHSIKVDAGCPAPYETFDAAEPKLGATLTQALRKQGFPTPTPIQAQGWPLALRKQGFPTPTPIQAQGWPLALQGKDMVAVAKTGSGKTFAFLLPALVRVLAAGPAPRPKKVDWYYTEPARPRTLVLAPTRELVQQIATEASKIADAAKARVVCVYGGVAKGDQCHELRQGVDILLATPGRLIDFTTPKPDRDLRAIVELSDVTYLVLDEADRMLDMGFEPDIRKIVGLCPKPSRPDSCDGAASQGRQTLFFTATWPKDVQSIARSLTNGKATQVSIGQGAGGDKLTANENIEQTVLVLRHEEKLPRLIKVLGGNLQEGETAMVFAATKQECDNLEYEIQNSKLKYWCRSIHSGKEQEVRDEVLKSFRDITAGKSGERGILICTDVAARGLDIPGVALVVVYDFALGSGMSGAESYVHRIGRTGRAGKKGRAFTFITEGENGADDLLELLRGAKQEVPPALEDLARQCKRKGRGGKGKGKGKGKGGKGKGKGGKGKGGRSKGWW